MVFFSIPATDARADAQKIQIAEFTITGAENAGELKTVLKNLLSSRIATDDLLVVDSADGTIAKITGSYSSFGKTFSIDASAKNAAGEALGQGYVQGENPFVVADARNVYLYRQTDSLKKVAEYAIKTEGKILALDTADVNNETPDYPKPSV